MVRHSVSRRHLAFFCVVGSWHTSLCDQKSACCADQHTVLQWSARTPDSPSRLSSPHHEPTERLPRLSLALPQDGNPLCQLIQDTFLVLLSLRLCDRTHRAPLAGREPGAATCHDRPDPCCQRRSKRRERIITGFVGSCLVSTVSRHVRSTQKEHILIHKVVAERVILIE